MRDAIAKTGAEPLVVNHSVRALHHHRPSEVDGNRFEPMQPDSGSVDDRNTI